MALQDSYAQMIEKARMLEEAGQHEHAFDVLRRMALRLGKLSPASLEKRPDLLNLFVSGLMDAQFMGRRMGKTDEVMELGDALERVLPKFVGMGALMKAQALNDAGRLDEGLALMQAASQREDSEPTAVKALASEALWFGRAEEALTMLATLPDSEPPVGETAGRQELAQVNYLRFRCLAALKRVDEAEQAWLSAYHQSRQDPPPSREIVTLFVEQGDLNKALEFADREAKPATRGLLRGMVALLKGKRDWANDEWWRVGREPFDVEKDDFVDWIECALRAGDLEKVDKALEAGIEKHGVVSRLLLLDAVFEALRGNVDIARRMLRTVVVVNHSAQLRREKHIWPSDRWLVEQTLTEEQGRSEFAELLTHTPTPEEMVEWTQPPAQDVSESTDQAGDQVDVDDSETDDEVEPAAEA